MIKIVALFGPAGSGKDAIQKKLIEQYPGTFHGIVSYTTRPPREGEVDGVDYHFVSEHDFFQMMDDEELLEWTEFRGWHYGTGLKDLSTDKINVGVFNISGVAQLRSGRPQVIPYLIECSDKKRLIRQLNREENPDVKEIVRRFQTDEEDFATIPFLFSSLVNEEPDDIETCANIIFGQNCLTAS